MPCSAHHASPDVPFLRAKWERTGLSADRTPASNRPSKVTAELAATRVYLGLSRDDVSGAMDRERRWVDDIEHGRQKVTGEELRKLSRLYRRPVAWLCGESTFQPSPEMLRQLENPRLTEGDREAALGFAEFLEGAGAPPKPVVHLEGRRGVTVCGKWSKRKTFSKAGVTCPECRKTWDFAAAGKEAGDGA